VGRVDVSASLSLDDRLPELLADFRSVRTVDPRAGQLGPGTQGGLRALDRRSTDDRYLSGGGDDNALAADGDNAWPWMDALPATADGLPTTSSAGTGLSDGVRDRFAVPPGSDLAGPASGRPDPAERIGIAFSGGQVPSWMAEKPNVAALDTCFAGLTDAVELANLERVGSQVPAASDAHAVPVSTSAEAAKAEQGGSVSARRGFLGAGVLALVPGWIRAAEQRRRTTGRSGLVTRLRRSADRLK
jgi:hypothetical protein